MNNANENFTLNGLYMHVKLEAVGEKKIEHKNLKNPYILVVTPVVSVFTIVKRRTLHIFKGV